LPGNAGVVSVDCKPPGTGKVYCFRGHRWRYALPNADAGDNDE
jgi:hypothetical protein